MNGKPWVEGNDLTASQVLQKLLWLCGHEGIDNEMSNGSVVDQHSQQQSSIADMADELSREPLGTEQASPTSSESSSSSNATTTAGCTIDESDDEMPPELQERQRSRLEQLFQQHHSNWQCISSGLKELVKACLQVSPANRLDPEQLLQHEYFADLYAKHMRRTEWVIKPFLRSERLSDDLDSWRTRVAGAESPSNGSPAPQTSSSSSPTSTALPVTESSSMHSSPNCSASNYSQQPCLMSSNIKQRAR